MSGKPEGRAGRATVPGCVGAGTVGKGEERKVPKAQCSGSVLRCRVALPGQYNGLSSFSLPSSDNAGNSLPEQGVGASGQCVGFSSGAYIKVSQSRSCHCQAPVKKVQSSCTILLHRRPRSRNMLPGISHHLSTTNQHATHHVQSMQANPKHVCNTAGVAWPAQVSFLCIQHAHLALLPDA